MRDFKLDKIKNFLPDIHKYGESKVKILLVEFS